jgi:hypothetical protein
MFVLRLLLVSMLIIPAILVRGSQADELHLVDIVIDQAKLVRLQKDASQVIVGNPAIADVTAQSARLLVITGKSYGTTNLIALDKDGRELFSTRLAVREGKSRKVTLYNGTVRQTYHCAPDCQRTLSIGDDKAQFNDLAQSVEKKFGVVNSAISGN